MMLASSMVLPSQFSYFHGHCWRESACSTDSEELMLGWPYGESKHYSKDVEHPWKAVCLPNVFANGLDSDWNSHLSHYPFEWGIISRWSPFNEVINLAGWHFSPLPMTPEDYISTD